MRRAAVLLAVIFPLALACSGPVDPGAGDSADEVQVKKHDVTLAGTVPLHEVSALAMRNGGLLALGDRDFKVVVGGTISRDGTIDVASKAVRDLSDLFPENVRGAQWEGMASDGSGKIFLLEENPGHVFVLDKDATKIVHTIELKVPDGGEEWQAAWNDSANSRGEGMVLLKNGHVLIAKEKDPKRLVEFGPRGEDARGFKGPADVEKGTFELRGAASTMVPLKAWKVGGKADAFGDLSELAVGPDGLYVLSDESRAIAHFAPFGADDDEASADKKWDLPFKKSDEDRKTEGLVLLSATRALVAVDGSRKDNVYVVDLAR